MSLALPATATSTTRRTCITATTAVEILVIEGCFQHQMTDRFGTFVVYTKNDTGAITPLSIHASQADARSDVHEIRVNSSATELGREVAYTEIPERVVKVADRWYVDGWEAADVDGLNLYFIALANEISDYR